MMHQLKEADQTEMCDRLPLDIEVDDESTGMSSYKEKWSPSSCLIACQASGMYEAAGNLTWVDPEVAASTTELPSEDPPWSWVKENAKGLFPISVLQTGRERIVFPTPLKCFRRGGIQTIDATLFPRGGLLPLSGHTFIYCWYLNVYSALGDGADSVRSEKELKLLFECALTVTINMFITEDMSILALEANRVSEFLRSTQRVSVNSFLTFMENVHLIGGSKSDLKALMKAQVQYNGGLINAAMLKVMDQLKKIDSDEVSRLFRQLDREFGHEVLTGSYNKLKLFCTAAKNADGAAWILMSQLVALRRKEVTVNDFPLTAYTKKLGKKPTSCRCRWQAKL